MFSSLVFTKHLQCIKYISEIKYLYLQLYLKIAIGIKLFDPNSGMYVCMYVCVCMCVCMLQSVYL